MLEDETINGLIIAVKPRTNAMLAILDPNALPTAVSTLPLNEAEAATIISGADEPIATIVKPISIGDKPMFFANAEAPWTKRSALQLKNKSPTKNITKALLISIYS